MEARNLPVIYIRTEQYDDLIKLGKDPKTFIRETIEEAIKQLKKDQK